MADGRRAAWAMAIGVAGIIGAIIVAADLGLPLPLRRMLAAPLVDKLGHFALFGILSWLAVRAAIKSWPTSNPASVGAVCSVILLVLSAVEEFSQNYIQARTFSVWDLGASSLGIGLLAVAAVRFAPDGSGIGAAELTDRRA